MKAGMAEAATAEPTAEPAIPAAAATPPSAPTPAEVDPDWIPVIGVPIVGVVRIIGVVRVGRRIIRVSVAGSVLRRRWPRRRGDNNGDGRESGRSNRHSPEPALLSVNEHGSLPSGIP